MGDLDKLIEAVEADADDIDMFPAISDMTHRNWFVQAYNGSLDAALRLHEALLPGWDYSIDNVQRVKPFVYVVDDGGPEFHAEAGTPARAFLLAILRALQAQPAPPDEPGPVDPRRRG